MKNIPEKIYLNVGFDKDLLDINDIDDFNELSELSWSTDRMSDNDIEYSLSKTSKSSKEIKQCDIPVVRLSLPNEVISEPIQNALYATNAFTTDQCNNITDGILLYLKDAGFEIVKSNEA